VITTKARSAHLGEKRPVYSAYRGLTSLKRQREDNMPREADESGGRVNPCARANARTFRL
jgi:hypothetical protein